MQGNIVTAAKWLGASLVLASVVLVGGLYWALSPRSDRLIAPTPARHSEVSATATPRPVEGVATESESHSRAGDEWERFWLLDQPSQMTPSRAHERSGP